MFALDTNTLIYLFKGQGRVAEHLFSQAVDRVAVPAVIVYELEVGLAKSNAPQARRRQLEELLAAIRVIPFGRDEAAAAARIRAKLERAGTPRGPMDTLIAGTALAHGATLVTRNRGEFSRVEGLQIEDWYG